MIAFPCEVDLGLGLVLYRKRTDSDKDEDCKRIVDIETSQPFVVQQEMIRYITLEIK